MQPSSSSPALRPLDSYAGLARSEAPRTTYYLARWLFLRFLGIVYFAAFCSLWVQIEGLIGSQGILPADAFLKAVEKAFGTERYYLFPTLCWYGADGFALHVLAGSGVVLAILLVAGILPGPACFGLWITYLSLSVVGQVFLSYQWDTLLLETGFLATFIAPWRFRPRLVGGGPPSRILIWLVWWLLFRLTFGSGMVKLQSGDPAWRHLTALQFHYETQPIPTWIGWYMHQLPGWFHKASAGFTFLVELALAVLIFGPRPCRVIAFIGIVLLQVLIGLTGNYGFFNLLTIALCLALLDDRCYPIRWRQRLGPALHSGTRLKQAWFLAVAVVIFTLTVMPIAGIVPARLPWPRWLLEARAMAASLRSFNGYGLFAVMTTTRPEIVIEVSNDGKAWLAYEFKWKAGDLSRRPAFTGLHMPRLDWQMWFQALGQEEMWFDNFLVRLLQGSPPVLGLLERNPFPKAPPKMIRANLYQYHFTDRAEKRATGAWWRRELLRTYTPPVSLPDRVE
jgi:hypothetical protein